MDLSRKNIFNFFEKIKFFKGWHWFKFNNLGLALDGLEVLHQCGKSVKTKSQTVCGANYNSFKSRREKLVGWSFCSAS